MKAFAIVIKNNPVSEHGFSVLRESSEYVGNDFEIERFDAYNPHAAFEFTSDPNNGVVWSYPWEGEELDMMYGLKKRAYETVNPYARVGCFLSHYHLWKKAVELQEDILILEHDAVFTKRYYRPLNNHDSVISINDPRGCTRKSLVYHQSIQCSMERYVPCPWVDADRAIPQGLPGNSAYVIGHIMARRTIDFVRVLGAWPNDALLCKQIFPERLWCLRDYATTVQKLGSTTSS